MGCFFGKFRKSQAIKIKEGEKSRYKSGSFRAPSGSCSTSVGGFKRLSETLTTRKFSWEKRGNVNHKEYKFEDLNDETLLKPPNSVNGNQFLIHKCKDSKLFVFDRCDSVHIDKCSNCVIFIGPTRNTVYVRNCENCRIMTACHQFRVRDCKDLDIWLFSLTRPAIEGCHSLKFSCYSYYYAGLQEQFQLANLNPFNNCWSEIVDFDLNERKFGNVISWEIMNKEHAEKGLEDFIPPSYVKVYDPHKTANHPSGSVSVSTTMTSHNVDTATIIASQNPIVTSPQEIALSSVKYYGNTNPSLPISDAPELFINPKDKYRQDSVLSSPAASTSGILNSPTLPRHRFRPKFSLGSATPLKQMTKPFTGLISSLFETSSSGGKDGGSISTIPYIEENSTSSPTHAISFPMDSSNPNTNDVTTAALSSSESPYNHTTSMERISSTCLNGHPTQTVFRMTSMNIPCGGGNPLNNVASSQIKILSPPNLDFDVDIFLNTISVDKKLSVVLHTLGSYDIESRWVHQESDIILAPLFNQGHEEDGGIKQHGVVVSPGSAAAKFIKNQLCSFGGTAQEGSIILSSHHHHEPREIVIRGEGCSPIAIEGEERSLLLSRGIQTLPLTKTSSIPPITNRNGVPTPSRKQNYQHCLVVFFWDGQNDDRAKIFVKELEKRYPECLLLQTRQLSINKSDSQIIFGSSHYEQTVEAGPAIGLEFYGLNAICKCTNTLKCLVMGTPGLVFVSNNPHSATLQIQNFFAYKDSSMS